jgi:3-oxoacyl-[acyl-carrier protein] reductase
MDLGIHGQAAIVVASSKGLGRASAEALAAEGVGVAICARNAQELEQAAAAMRERGAAVLAVPADVTDAQQLEQLVARTVDHFGRLDILVNNAGGPPPGTFDDVTDEQWEQAFHLNLLSAVRLIRLAVPHMRQQGGGRIVNIVSSSVKEPIDNLILSNSIRAGVIGLAKTLSRELGPHGITVNNVLPGRILTDRLRSLHQRSAQQLGVTAEEVARRATQDIPLGRLGVPEDLGAVVAFLASKPAGYLTGVTIQVDGGMLRTLM